MIKGPLIGRGRTADIYALGDDRVIKLFYPDRSPDSVRRELDAAQLVEKAGLPVPHVESELVTIDARSGIVYERINGTSMLRLLQMNPWRVIELGRLMAELHAAIHRCVAPQLALYKYSLQRSIEHASLLLEIKKQVILSILASLPEGAALCHCDFHPDNIILTKRGPRIIDWMTAAQGNPLADVARTSMLLRLGDPPPHMRARWLIHFLRDLFYSSYIKRYLSLQSAEQLDVDAWRVPTMAARLNEDIPAEHSKLLRLIDEALAEQTVVNQ